MTRTSKVVLAILGVLVIALAGGYFGAGLRGGSSSSSGGGTDNGAFLDAIKQRGELRVGVALAPPMTAKQADGTLGGPNLIPLQDLAKQLNVKLVPVAADWSNIVAGLQAGRYDFAANLDATVQRAVAIQFTDSVYDYQGVLVLPSSAQYSKATAVVTAGKAIATAQGSAPETAIKDLGASVLSIANYTEAIAAVKAGRAVAEFTDLPTAESQIEADSSLKVIVPNPEIYSASAAYGVPASADARSLQAVNIAIARSQSSGALRTAYKQVNYYQIEDLPSSMVKQ